MECKEAREHLAELARGHLEGELLERVERHLDGCRDCRLELERERALDELLALYDSPGVGPEFDRALHEKLNRVAGSKRAGLARKLAVASAALAAAAGILLAIHMYNVPAGGSLDEDVTLSRDLDLYENLEVLELMEALQDIGDAGVLEGGEPT